MNKTELIVGFKLVNTPSGEQFLVTTNSNAQVFVPKAQFDTSAGVITYQPMKAGDKYTDRKTKEVRERKSDGNNFVCTGSRTAPAIAMIDFLTRGSKSEVAE